MPLGSPMRAGTCPPFMSENQGLETQVGNNLLQPVMNRSTMGLQWTLQVLLNTFGRRNHAMGRILS